MNPILTPEELALVNRAIHIRIDTLQRNLEVEMTCKVKLEMPYSDDRIREWTKELNQMVSLREKLQQTKEV